MVNQESIRDAWSVLCSSYPTFKDRYGAEVSPIWAGAMRKLSDAQLRHGLNEVMEGTLRRIPSLSEFIGTCREVGGDQPEQRFRNPIPKDKRPTDSAGDELPWWSYIHPSLDPMLSHGAVSTYLELKGRMYPDQPWLVDTNASRYEQAGPADPADVPAPF
jgi:hypothetical protein